uniref:peptidoglycan-binding protein n=1 Tax=Streptomyces sp. CHD11 TaxID=2741325 RepID=UPI0027E42AB0|nr:peptidoglycan-binding protein [Streptomyces sp. CHD11]
MSSFWSDGYRQDCSGYVSMAWNLPGNEWTGSLAQHAERIGKDELQPGDILLFHNSADPYNGSHVVLFGGWADSARTRYVAYEQTSPHTRRATTPYAYWSNSARYVPYRYKGVTGGTAGGAGEPAASLPSWTSLPGVAHFSPGVDSAFLTKLRALLVNRGAGPVHGSPPGPPRGDADRGTDRAFQEARGRRGAAGSGPPGPTAGRPPVTGEGRDLPSGASSSPSAYGTGGRSSVPSSHGVPGCPGRGPFRSGAENDHVTRLGRQLVAKGFGRHYTDGPGPRWGEEDRRNVEAFQRAQGWRGGAANGTPGPETWRRLFS